MDKKVNAKRIASAKFRKAKNKEIALANNLCGLPGENRTHNRNLGGSRYIHLTTGRFFMFLKLFYDTKIIKFIPIFIPI